jgi:hypothetical protein
LLILNKQFDFMYKLFEYGINDKAGEAY